MSDPEKPLPLAADFAPATEADWRKLVDAVLKGAPFARLEARTYDGIAVAPLAAGRADARPIAGRPGAAPWQIMARIDHPDPVAANEIALRELENGASGLSLVYAGAAGAYGFGLPPREEVLARVLDGVEADAGVAIELDVSTHAAAAIDAALARGPAASLRTRSLRIGHDPLGAMALDGGAARHWSEAAPHFARRLAALSREGLPGRLCAADGRIIHNAGGSEAQELAFALAVALAYLRAIEGEGVALEDARRMIFFRLVTDADQLLTVAKFRGLQILWGRVEAACGLAPEPAFVTTETAWRMMTRRDPHVNMLRTTIAAFAAALGGADAIGVLPFTQALGLPDEPARRLARNTQLILLEESHLDKVADPAAGAGAVEDMTERLCHAAWALFQEIEAAGGAAAALESGLIQGEVAAMREKRAAAIARLEDAVTGVSIFPALEEARVGVLAATLLSGAAPSPPQTHPCGPLRPIRLAEPFEALRDASDRLLAATGVRPKIFLAALGTPAESSPRAAYATNFFEAGGIEAVGSSDGAAPAAAFTASGAALACICGPDPMVASAATATADALKTAGARHIYLAGRPGADRAAGIDTFIYNGCNALAVLEAAHRLLASRP